MIFLKAYFQLCSPIVQYLLMPDSVGLGSESSYYDYFRNRPRIVLPVEGKAPYLIIFGETAVQCN